MLSAQKYGKNLHVNYSPFGAILYGRNWSSEEYRYGFNGMEKDDEMKGTGNSYDFGARMYDSRLGRWLSLDAYSNKYNDLSPYSFVANLPIIATDPTGEVIIITLTDGTSHTYDPKMTVTSTTDVFLKQVHEAFTYITTVDPNGGGKVIQDLVNETSILTIEKTTSLDPKIANIHTPTLDMVSKTIESKIVWNPLAAMEIVADNGSARGTAVSPSTMLLHELDHAQRVMRLDDPKTTEEDVKQYNADNVEYPKGSPMSKWTKPEELRVISNLEKNYIKKANEYEALRTLSSTKTNQVQGTRNNHGGIYYTTDSVNSITPSDSNKAITGTSTDKILVTPPPAVSTAVKKSF